MALNIKDPATERYVRELAAATGEGVTATIRTAVQERLVRVRRNTADPDMLADLRKIVEHFQSLPTFDTRTPDEILGYDENGLPT